MAEKASEKITLSLDSRAWKDAQVGNLLQPLEFVPESRKHVLPTEWQVRTVLGDCISKANVISISSATVSPTFANQ